MKKLIVVLFIGMLSFVGGLVMYAVGERQTLWQIWADKELSKYLLLSSLSVCIYLLYIHYSTLWVYRRVSWRVINLQYFFICYGGQLLISGLGSIVMALFMASLMSRWYYGLWLHQTSYFNADFYVVLVSTGLLQLFYISLHFFICRQRQDLGIKCQYLAEDKDYRKFRISKGVYDITKEQIAESKPHLQEQLDNLGIELHDIAYIYSFNKIRFLVMMDSTIIPNIELPLETWAFLLPNDQFLAVRRNLIIAKQTISKEYVIQGSRIGLILHPLFTKGKVTLSRVSTRIYKDWKAKQ